MVNLYIEKNGGNAKEINENNAMQELKDYIASLNPEDLLTEEEAIKELDADGADLLVYESGLDNADAANICAKLGVPSVSEGFNRLDSYRYTHAVCEIRQRKKEAIINPEKIIENRFLSDLYCEDYSSELRFDKKSLAERAGVKVTDIAEIDTASVITYDRIGEAVFSLLAMKAQLAELYYKDEHDYPLTKSQKALRTFLKTYLKTPLSSFPERKLDVCCIMDFLLDNTLQKVYFKAFGDENSRVESMKYACERIRHIKVILRNGTFIEIEKNKDEFSPLDLAALEIMEGIITAG